MTARPSGYALQPEKTLAPPLSRGLWLVKWLLAMPTLCGRAAAVSAVALVALVASVAPARADTVTDWNANASTAIVVTAGQPPPAAVLSFAMVQGAVYDAVNAIDRGHRSVSAPARGRGRGF